MTDTPDQQPPADSQPTPSPPPQATAGGGTTKPAPPKNKRGFQRAPLVPELPANSVRTPSNSRKVIAAFGVGLTLAYAAAAAGISTNALREWMKADESFAVKCYHAKTKTAAKVVSAFIKAATEGDVQAGKFILERLDIFNREMCKFNPETVTPEMLASAISRVVALVTPFIPAGDMDAMQVKLSDIYRDLKPPESAEVDDGR